MGEIYEKGSYVSRRDTRIGKIAGKELRGVDAEAAKKIE